MIRDILFSILQFVLLILAQVFILNNINFLGFINPMIYVWFIILLPFSSPKWLVLLYSFVLGFCVDIFSSDIGINALVCVFVGFLRPMLLNVFSGNIDNFGFRRPSISSLGLINFLLFAGSTVMIHHMIYFLIYTFAWNEILQVILRTLISSIVTLLLILLLDMIFFKKRV